MGTLVLCLVFTGCQTSPKVQNSNETNKEAQEALTAVAGALSGKQLSKEDLRDLQKQIESDEDAQSAIQAITESVGGKGLVVKYCPITGRRYAAHIETCPEHEIKLEIVGR